MKKNMVFIGKFFLFSLLFFIIWVFVGKYYLCFLAYVTTPILHVLGYKVTVVVQESVSFLYLGAEMGLAHAEMTNYTIIPFLALIMATPGNITRIKRNLFMGLPILFLFHMVNLIAHFPYYYEGDFFSYFIISVSALTRMMIPFVLWFGLNYDYVLSSFRKTKKIYRCPICGKKTSGILMHISDAHKEMNSDQKKKVGKLYSIFPELNQ